MSITYEYSSILTAISLGLLVVLTISAFIINRRDGVLPYVALLIVFTGTSYGLGMGMGMDSKAVISTIYTRGDGVFVFTLINMYLFLLFLFSFFASRFDMARLSQINAVNIPLITLCCIVIFYYVYALLMDLPPRNVFSQFGLINLVNMFMFAKVLSWNINDEAQIRKFIKVVLYLTAGMAFYGLFRYVFFGGDPANYYRNFEKQAVKITFFDYGQSVLFCIAVSYLYQKYKVIRQSPRVLDYLIMGMCLLNIVLSFRRNAWLGLLFMSLWLFLISDARRKVVIVLAAVAVLVVGASVYTMRFQNKRSEYRQSIGVTGDLTTRSGDVNIKKGRFGELYGAVMLVSDKSPVLGLGPWGINEPRVNKGFKYDFVHSTFVYMYIKLGTVGLILYISLLLVYIQWWLRVRRREWYNISNKIIAESFFCGFLMELPDLFFGTPFIIFRHAQILAMLFSIPFICWALDNKMKSFQESAAIEAS